MKSPLAKLGRSERVGVLGGSLLVAAVAFGACAEDPDPIQPTGSGSSSTGTTGPGSGSAGEGGSTGSGEGGSSGSSNPTSSGTTNPTSGGPSAQEMFVNDVYPLLSAPSQLGLACTTCHATGSAGAPVFFASTAEGSYNAIVAYEPSMIAAPANSNLVLHGPHAGPALDDAQEEAVIAWLDQEVIERDLDNPTGGGEGGGAGEGGGGDGGSGPVDPPLTLALALEQFGDCMNYDIWMNTGMTNLPECQTEIGPCQGCHNAGDGGAWLSANDMETFERNRTYPYVKKLVTGTVDENGAFDTLIPARRFIEKGNEGCDPEIQNCHPEFVLPPDMVEAVEQFVDITLERWMNGECEEPVGQGGAGGGLGQ